MSRRRGCSSRHGRVAAVRRVHEPKGILGIDDDLKAFAGADIGGRLGREHELHGRPGLDLKGPDRTSQPPPDTFSVYVPISLSVRPLNVVTPI